MRANPLCSLLLATLACLPEAPPMQESSEADSSESFADSAWPEIDPPSTPGPDSDGTDADSDAPTPPDLIPPEPPAEAHLRIVGVEFDPDGSDGAAGAPEWIELLSLGPEPYPLARLRIEARSWPLIEASDLDSLDPEALLQPGSRLRVERYASAENLPLDDDEGPLVRLAFSSSSGLRNADGALRVFAADGSEDDQLCYGSAVQPEPFGDARAWSGPCAPEDGGPLCRLNSTADSNQAADWGPCAPPGKKATPPVTRRRGQGKRAFSTQGKSKQGESCGDVAPCRVEDDPSDQSQGLRRRREAGRL